METYELQELLNTVAFPETPEERDAAERAVAAMLGQAWRAGAEAMGASEAQLEANPYMVQSGV